MSTKIIDIEETIFELERISGEITCDLESMYKQLIRFGSICCEYEQEMEPQSVENLEKMYNAYKNYVDHNRHSFDNILKIIDKSVSMLKCIKDITVPS